MGTIVTWSDLPCTVVEHKEVKHTTQDSHEERYHVTQCGLTRVYITVFFIITSPSFLSFNINTFSVNCCMMMRVCIFVWLIWQEICVWSVIFVVTVLVGTNSYSAGKPVCFSLNGKYICWLNSRVEDVGCTHENLPNLLCRCKTKSQYYLKRAIAPSPNWRTGCV